MRIILKPTCYLFILGISLFTQSCKKDPRFDISAGSINSQQYTAGGTLSFLYSTDGGTTFSPTIPADLKDGAVVKVKVTNGTMNLSADDFTFDWSASSPRPSNISADIAEFSINDANLSISLTVVDKTELVAVNSNSGKFYSLNKATGAATEAFTVTYNSAALTSIRSLAYNYSNGLLYAGLSQKGSGKIMSINPATKQATVINENTGDVSWDGVTSLVITPDNRLLTTMYVNNYQSLTSFSLTGTAATPIKLTGADPCCGMGMIFNSATELLIGDYNYYNDNNKAVIYKASLNGAISQTVQLDLVNFGTLTGADVYIRSLVKDESGTIYGIVYTDFEGSNTNDASHLVKVDMTAKTITSIAKIGLNNTNQYLGLAIIPSYIY